MKINQKMLVALAFCATGFGSQARAQQSDLVWIEAENTASTNLKIEANGWGNKQFLSGEKWVNINIDADKVAAQLPADGGLLSYKFALKADGKHEIWNRVGFEFVRSPFEWRVDGGEWNKSSPSDLTTDLMDIAQWTEVAWLKLSERDFQAGDHTLDIRLSQTKNDKGEIQRVLYASDAIAISSGEFRPDGPNKPGTYQPTATDIAAAKKVWELPAVPAANGARSSVKLDGLWEIARADETLPTSVATPMELPTSANWKSIAVPGDKNKERPDLLFAHRVWYRTRINVPQNQAGRSGFLHFPMNSLNTSVYVNRQLCGFNNLPFAPFQIDVSKALKAGENEVLVGIRDVWYGRTFNPKNPMKFRQGFNLPVSYFGQGFQDLDYPIWNNTNSGILETPTFTSVGAVYTRDAFAKPSVARKQLGLEITVNNPTNSLVSGEIAWSALDDKTGALVKTFAPKSFTVAANSEQIVTASGAWTDPKLWWPDSPQMYRLRATVNVDGKAIDTSDTPFGFREWTSSGIKYLLNGVSWPQWADLSPSGNTTEEWIRDYKAKHQRTMRVMNPGQGSGQTRNWGLPQAEMFDIMDRNGVVIRRNGLLDGQVIGYQFSEGDPDIKVAQGGSEMKVALMNNYRDQFAQLIRGERNHPSINVWTFDNEFLYINLINLLGDGPLMNEYERKFAEMVADWAKVDPTRFFKSDGGGALKAQVLPIHGNHYVFDPKDTRYPNLAYELNPEGGSRGRWPWDMKRPRFMGEDFFATGINPADYAQWGGEAMFLSKASARPGSDFVFNMLMQGYRWAGQGAWHFWAGTGENVHGWNSMKDRAVFVREYDWTFGSGQKTTRTFGIFNDTHYDAPITFTRTLLVGNRSAWTKKSEHKIAAGGELKFGEEIPLPVVAKRTDGELIVALSVGGKEVFRDSKPLSILATTGATTTAATLPKTAAKPKRASLEIQTHALAQVKPAAAPALSVYDPSGKIAAFLKARGTKFTPLKSLSVLPATGKVLVIGPDALSQSESTSSALAAWASTGRTVIVLDQKNPLRYQALTAELDTVSKDATETDSTNGNFAFSEDLGHPTMRDLGANDFKGWGRDGRVYRNAYKKPARGARSLIQVGPRLEQSALVEVPTGKGLMLLSQLDLGAKIGTNAVAQQLMQNLLAYGSTYKQEFRNVALVSGGEAQLTKAADGIGLQYDENPDPIAAISDPKIKLAVVEATPVNLQKLAGDLAKVKAFNARGGYIVFHGLTPEGLGDYNKLVGFDHMIRKMGRERILFSDVKDPLMAGLTLGDVVLLSGERIFGWVSDEYTASDMFSYLVDFDDVAPFAKSTFFAYDKITNGFVGSDGWPLIINYPLEKDAAGEFKASTIPISFSKPQTIREWTWIGNKNYWIPNKVSLAFDGKDKQVWGVPAKDEPITLPIKTPRAAKEVTLGIEGWEVRQGVNPLVGIDNISLIAARPADFYQRVKPMLNIGGMMHYPRGKGGLVLCNLLFKDLESVPVNVQKKRTIFSALLRNLQAPFAGGKTIIAGANVNYSPIDFGKFPEKLTQYRTERGWFGDNNFSFNAFPRGEQKFAGVAYNIFDFATSPVPTAIMLGGNGIPNNAPSEVKDIPIGRKADALFFLHTARIDSRRNPNEIRDNKKYEMARYTINYADGQSVQLPIYAEIDIESYRQETPRAVPGAQIAWTSPFPNSKESAVAYSKQWNNPRPDVEIKSVDFSYGPDDQKRGVPVLLAITAATSGK